MSAAAIPPHVFEQPAPRFDIERVQTPAYVVDLGLLRQNAEKLARVQAESGCKVLLAQKGFSMFATYPLLREYLSGCCASGLYEALLAHEEFGGEVHVYAPAFKEDEMRQLIPIAHHISFNSLAQWRKWRPMLDAARARGERVPSPGIRVNPEHSEVEVALYDPCSPGCRLGIRAEALEGEDLEGLEGLHFHALCEQDSDVLERTLAAVEQRFPRLLAQVKWVNMGGGHHITRNSYDVPRLVRVVRDFKARWDKDVYLEPGEAVALNTGYLITSVVDIVGETNPQKTVLQSLAHQPQNKQTHENHRTPPHRSRTPADSQRAARALIQSLADAAQGIDRPNAAQRLDTEAQCLRQWATDNGWLITEEELSHRIGSATELDGASEHDVYLDAAAGRVLKLTMPPNFGARGEAAAYLTNLLACNTLLNDDWCFEGVVDGVDGLRIASSQPFVLGERASVPEIDAYFGALGMTKERENTYARADGLRVADARPDNILRDAAGRLLPIDIHILGVALEDLPEAQGKDDNAAPLPTAILDCSATAHMPDTLEMPYRPHILGADWPDKQAHAYRLGGMTCLAGDVINDYSFPQPLRISDKLVFTDMAHYTMVKTTMFNGVEHPDIVTFDPATDELKLVRRFGYEDFKRRLS